jgi:hypothetical protein
MKPLVIIIGLLLFIQTYVYAAAPQDVHGWNKVKWGMTESEVEAAYPNKILPYTNVTGKDCGSTQELERQLIGGYSLDVMFNYDCKTKKLNGVTIVPYDKWYRQQATEAFDAISKEFSVEYGDPSTSNISEIDADRKWVFPSTSIEMTLIAVDDSTPAIFMINYKERE